MVSKTTADEIDSFSNMSMDETDFQVVSDIQIPDVFFRKFSCGLPIVDALVGKDGFLPGSSFTMTAPAGTGKTTFCLQTMEAFAANGKRVGYISGEESVYQLAFTCKRLGVKRVKIANKTDVDTICSTLENFDVVMVDSFQMLQSKKVNGGTKLQKYCIHRLVKAAKETECVLGVICHLTKDGKLKGDSSVIHAVDMNMEIWKGDPEVYDTHHARVIRVVKNRFGQCGSVVLKMGERGYDFHNPIALDEISESDITSANASQKRKQGEYDEVRKLVLKKEKITIKDVASALGVDAGRAKRLLADLVELEDLDKVGDGRTGVQPYYIRGPSLVSEEEVEVSIE